MAFRQYCMRMIDQEPVVALSTAIGFIAFVTPVVVIPIRQSLGYSNSQYLGEGGGAFPLWMRTGSSAAMGIATRQGDGKTLHLDTRILWLQHAVGTGRMELVKA